MPPRRAIPRVVARVELTIDPPRRDRWNFLAKRAGMTRTGFLKAAVELTDARLAGNKTEEQRVMARLTRLQNEERRPADTGRRSNPVALQQQGVAPI